MWAIRQLSTIKVSLKSRVYQVENNHKDLSIENKENDHLLFEFLNSTSKSAATFANIRVITKSVVSSFKYLQKRPTVKTN